jgi:hypothetical protein
MRGFASSFNSSHVSGFNIHSGYRQLRAIRQSDNNDRGTAPAQVSNQLDCYSMERVISVADFRRIQIMSSTGTSYDIALRRICWRPARTCARSSSCWDISVSKIRRSICMCPADTCRRPSIRWIRSRSGTFKKTADFLTTSNDTPTLGGGRCHSVGRQSISRSLSKVFDLSTGQGIQRHHALPDSRARWASRSVRSLPASDHLIQLVSQPPLPKVPDQCTR